jgi:hypothetical protein
LEASRVREILKSLCDKKIIEPHGGNRDRYYTLKY